MKWQSIETAPKDGNYVLVFCPVGPNSIEIAHWSAADDIVYTDDDGWYRDTMSALSSEPSHWMPLPDAPDLGR